MPIQQPGGKIKMGNVACVRLKKAGKRFECACYPNTVQDWRRGVQKDLSEVLQTEEVYENLSKAQVAKQADLQKAFGTTDKAEICKVILEKGEVQVAEKERGEQLEALRKEVATGVAERVINPESQKPWPVSMIEKALSDIHFNPQTNKPVKSQILFAIKQLQESKTIPIQRARMRVRVTMPAKDGKRVKDKIVEACETIEEDEWTEEWELIALIDPGQFRVINEVLQSELKGRGRLETLSFAAVEGEGDERIE